MPSRISRFALGVVLLSWCACEPVEPPEFTFYDNRIAPVLEVGCQQQTTGCHIASPEGTAPGNLDLTNYDSLLRRPDVLLAAGPYPVGQLLLKGGDQVDIGVSTLDPPDPAFPEDRLLVVTTDIRHAGGQLLREGADGYAELKRWIEAGYTRSGSPRDELSENRGACLPGPGVHPRFDPSVEPEEEAFREFARDVQPVLVQRCAGSVCHGTPVAALHLSCGQTDEETRWNYFVATQHVDADLVSTSELLRRPLSDLRGGVFHEGGDVFPDVEDDGYEVLRDWAENLAAEAPATTRFDPEEEGLRFFANWVQPVLVREGCMFMNCHSPSMFHDLRLHGGSQGQFSPIAIERNYEMARLQLAVESADPSDSRLIAKNLFPPELGGSSGLAHRGGALFEDFDGNARAESCEGIDVEDAAGFADVPSYCVLARWHEIERLAGIASGELTPDVEAVIYVERPLELGDPRDFDTYRPGADLVRLSVQSTADGGLQLTGERGSLLAGCGLNSGSADVRGPAVSWDGTRLAFAARSSASAPLRVFEASVEGGDCAPIAGLAASETEANGILVHDFDPAYAPDGRIVFASTRGTPASAGFGYDGPTRTPSQLAPNANLYIYSPGSGEVQQLTYLLNQEISPAFMADGRLMMTAEKREAEFFQLAGRRQNLDGADYHPLFAQRGSVGFARATEIIELPNRNLAMVAAPADAADGAGTIAVVNRSIGPDEEGGRPGDPLYFSSVSYPSPGAFVETGSGVFRSPGRLPTSRMLVSYDDTASELTSGSYDFDLYVLDPATGGTTLLFGQAGVSEVEAVAVYARPDRGIFTSRADEANGNTRIEAGATDATVVYQDVPLLGTLLFSNTRAGRPLDDRVGGFEMLEARPPPAGATSFADLGGDVVEDAFGSVFVSYRSLGWTGLQLDGSAHVRIPGGAPVLMRLTDSAGDDLSIEGIDGIDGLTGTMIQREQMQFYPGERSNQGFPRRLFNAMCGACHGSLTGFELDIAVDPDVLTGPSQVLAHDLEPETFSR